jgi:hypothetical protein
LELRHRVGRLLRRLEANELTEDQRRRFRAVAALERADTPAARLLLRKLSGGHPDAALTYEADSSLRRLVRKRPQARP